MESKPAKTVKSQASKTMLIDIPPDILQRMNTGRLQPPPARRRLVRRGPRAIRVKDRTPTVTIHNADLQELFQGVYDAGFITDLKGYILDANVRATQFFLYGKRDFVELSMVELVIGFNETVVGTILENLENDKFTLIMAQCLRRDGSHFPAEISSSRLTLSKQDYLCFFIRDITARREAEDALIKAHDDLEREVAERTRINEELRNEIAERTRAEKELNEAIRKLKEHDRAKSQFVSNVSHELKTPLTSITYISSNMLKGIVGRIPKAAREYLEMILLDCRRLSRTVEDILDMSRIEAETLKLNLVKIPFDVLMHRTAETLKLQAEAEDLTMTVTMGDEHLFVECDPQKMERVIFNIVKNAIKFNMKDGTIEMVLCRDADDSRWVNMDTIDSGMGIAKEHLARVTERFYRVGELVSGTGLGLAISKDLVERLGGVLEIDSPPPGRDRGTQVRVHLPLTAAPTVLIVYTNMNTRLLLTRQLADYGYRVLSSENKDEALDLMESEGVGLVVVDWADAGLDDGLIIAKIRNNPAWRHIPFVAVTNEEAEQTKLDIIEGFGIARLVRPWKPQRLFDALYDMTVNKKRLERLNS